MSLTRADQRVAMRSLLSTPRGSGHMSCSWSLNHRLKIQHTCSHRGRRSAFLLAATASRVEMLRCRCRVFLRCVEACVRRSARLLRRHLCAGARAPRCASSPRALPGARIEPARAETRSLVYAYACYASSGRRRSSHHTRASDVSMCAEIPLPAPRVRLCSTSPVPLVSRMRSVAHDSLDRDCRLTAPSNVNLDVIAIPIIEVIRHLQQMARYRPRWFQRLQR